MSEYYLARFRADPEIVRVGMRRMNGGWLVTIECRLAAAASLAFPVGAWNVSGRKAVVLALRRAWLADVPGVDMNMCRAHKHPFGVLGPHVTGPFREA